MKIEVRDYGWLQYEPDWKAIVHSRLEGACTKSSIEVEKESSFSIASELRLSEGLLTSLNLEASAEASFSKQGNVAYMFTVEFPGADEQQRPRAQARPSGHKC